jgi:hypothetical protein
MLLCAEEHPEDVVACEDMAAQEVVALLLGATVLATDEVDRITVAQQ